MVNDILASLTLDRYRIVAILLEYIVILLAIIADLITGVNKAKREGKLRTSYGFRKTLSKMSQYFGAAFWATFIDVLQMYLILGFNNETNHRIFMFPFVTLILTFYVCVIEYKSIRENRETKTNARIEEVTNDLKALLKSKDNIETLEKIVAILRGDNNNNNNNNIYI